MHPGFIQKCEQWRNRAKVGKMGDVYDGKVWTYFLNYEGKPFLSLPFKFALHLNVDWYQPLERTQHSEGAIHPTLLIYQEKRGKINIMSCLLVLFLVRENQSRISPTFVADMLSLWKGVVQPFQEYSRYSNSQYSNACHDTSFGNTLA